MNLRTLSLNFDCCLESLFELWLMMGPIYDLSHPDAYSVCLQLERDILINLKVYSESYNHGFVD